MKNGSEWTVKARQAGCEITVFNSDDTFTAGRNEGSGTWSGGANSLIMEWTAGANSGPEWASRRTPALWRLRPVGRTEVMPLVQGRTSCGGEMARSRISRSAGRPGIPPGHG